MLSVQGIPDAQKPSYSLIGRINIGGIKSEGIRIGGRWHYLALPVKHYISVKRVKSPRNTVGWRSKIEEIFYASVDFPFFRKRISQLDILDAVPF